MSGSSKFMKNRVGQEGDRDGLVVQTQRVVFQMEGWAVNISLTQMPQEREGLNLQDIWGRCSPGWGLEAGVFWLRRWVVRTGTQWLKQSEAENGLFLISIHLLMISFFTFAFSFKGIPSFWWLPVVFFFFPLQLFLISQNHRVVCSSVSFHVPAFPFSVSLSVFICLLFPSGFLPGTYSYYNSSQTLVQHF